MFTIKKKLGLEGTLQDGRLIKSAVRILKKKKKIMRDQVVVIII
jgi:hypothetical protein